MRLERGRISGCLFIIAPTLVRLACRLGNWLGSGFDCHDFSPSSYGSGTALFTTFRSHELRLYSRLTPELSRATKQHRFERIVRGHRPQKPHARLPPLLYGLDLESVSS